MQDSAPQNGAQFYIIPFFYNRSLPATNIDSLALTLQKQVNATALKDCAIVARVVANAHLPYQQWNYPNLTSFDSISRSG